MQISKLSEKKVVLIDFNKVKSMFDKQTANIKGTTESFSDLDEILQDDLEIYMKVRLGQMGYECINNCISWLKDSHWVRPQSMENYKWSMFIAGLMLIDVFYCAAMENSENETAEINKSAFYDYFEYMYSRLFMNNVETVFRQPLEMAFEFSREDFQTYLPLFKSGILTYNTIAINIADPGLEVEKRILYCFSRMLALDGGEIVDNLSNSNFHHLFLRFVHLYSKAYHLPSWLVILMFYPTENSLGGLERSYTLTHFFQQQEKTVNLRLEKDDSSLGAELFSSLAVNQSKVAGKILNFSHEDHKLMILVNSFSNNVTGKMIWTCYSAKVDELGTFELSLLDNGKCPTIKQVLLMVLPQNISTDNINSERLQEFSNSALVKLKFTDRQRQVDLVGKWNSRIRDRLARKIILSMCLNGDGEVMIK